MSFTNDDVQYLKQIAADLVETAEVLAAINPRRKRKNCARAIHALTLHAKSIAGLADNLENMIGGNADDNA